MAQETKEETKEKTKNKSEKLKCTMCGKEKVETDFYMSYSILFKSNKNRMCICKLCVSKLFDAFQEQYKSDIRAIYEMCRILDVYFDKSAYEASLAQAERKNSNIAGTYFQKINSLPQWSGKTFGMSDKLEDKDIKNDNDKKSRTNTQKELVMFWGKGFDKEDYEFLEDELYKWQKTHKCDNQSELTLLKEICTKILQIRKAREKGEDDGKLQEELQRLMKTASVDPAKANKASAGESVDCWGLFVKDIEEKRPAEWWQDQEKYKDKDGFVPYLKNYLTRPLKNFFTGTKDFVIDNEDLSFKGDE